MTGQDKFDKQTVREDFRPGADDSIFDRLLPADIFYFQVAPASGEFRPGAGWRDSLGYEDECWTIPGWLDIMPVDERDRLRRVLAELASGAIEQFEGRVRMANAQGVATDAEITLLAEHHENEDILVHGIQRSVDDSTPDNPPEPDLTHEFANDLASIAGFGELLKATALTAAQQAYVDEMLGAARRSAEQLASRRSIRHARNAPDWNNVLGEALGIDAAHPGPTRPPPWRPDELTGLLRPLLARRRQHAREDTAIRLHWLSASRSRTLGCATCGAVFQAQDFVGISLRDHGPALHRDLIPAFFAPGFDAGVIRRADGSPDRDEVSAAIENLHERGGHVTLRSTPEITAIGVYLSTLTEGNEELFTASGNRILVVDDNDGVRGYLDALLTRAGYRVTVAAGPIDAIEVFDKAGDEFDLIISDVTMPGMSGQAMLTHMQGRAPRLGVIVCTGMDSVDGLATGWRRLGKPVDPDELLACIKDVLGAP